MTDEFDGKYILNNSSSIDLFTFASSREFLVVGFHYVLDFKDQASETKSIKSIRIFYLSTTNIAYFASSRSL